MYSFRKLSRFAEKNLILGIQFSIAPTVSPLTSLLKLLAPPFARAPGPAGRVRAWQAGSEHAQKVVRVVVGLFATGIDGSAKIPGWVD